MLQFERTGILQEYLEKHHSATVKQIAKDIHMSETTVRRDLAYLEKQHIVRRSYGFAVLLKYQNNTLPFLLRMQDNRKEKNIIAQKAVGLVKTGDTLIMDESSTTSLIANLLDPSMDLTVFTTSLIIANILAEKRIRTYCTGGPMVDEALLLPELVQRLTGKYAEPLIASIYADKCFFSSSGIMENGIICDKMEESASINKLMLQHAEKKIYLCDHTKFNRSFPYLIAKAEDIDYFISDREPPESYRKQFKIVL